MLEGLSVRGSVPCLTLERRSQRVLHVLTGHQNKIYCAAFSPDSTLVFSGGVLLPSPTPSKCLKSCVSSTHPHSLGARRRASPASLRLPCAPCIHARWPGL